uniref:Glycoprotein n=1 Tax=Panagrellus redivivus TaxID=6233 RepID=A0A7E4VVV4_PANRE
MPVTSRMLLILAFCLCFRAYAALESFSNVSEAETVQMIKNDSVPSTVFSLTPVVVQHDVKPEPDIKLKRSWTELPRSFEDAYMKAKEFFSQVPNDAFTRVFAAIYANVIVIIVIYALLIIRNVHKSLQYVRHVRRTSFMRTPTFVEDAFNASTHSDDVQTSRIYNFSSTEKMNPLVRTEVDEAAYEDIDTTLESVFSGEADGYEIPRTLQPRGILQKPGSFRPKTPEAKRHVSFPEAISQEFPVTPPSDHTGSTNTTK